MKSQIYGTLGILYAIAIGILLIIAVVGISKQFSYKSSAPLYKMEAYSLSQNFQILNMLFNQERAYSIERSIFLTSAFGGRTPKELTPTTNASICKCKNGYHADASSGLCVDGKGDAYVVTCYVDHNGNRINVSNLPNYYYPAIPEKTIVYWINGSYNMVPSKSDFDYAIGEYASKLFAQPDPLLKAFFASFSPTGTYPNTIFKVKVNILDNKVIAHWIPLGVNRFVFAFPNPIDPDLYYEFNLRVNNVISLNFTNLYSIAANFANKGEYTNIINNITSSPFPTVIDEEYVTKYYNKDIDKTVYCNYSVSATPYGNQTCTDDSSTQPHYLGPIKAMYYYLLIHHKLNFWDYGDMCNTFDYPVDINAEWTTPPNNKPLCIAEVTPNITQRGITLRVVNFYGWCVDTGDYNDRYALEEIVCSMDRQLQEKLNDYYQNGSIYIKMLPLKPFNITLDSATVSSQYSWTNDSFEKTFTVDYCYSSIYGTGAANPDYALATGNSICEKYGFSHLDYMKSPYQSNEKGCYVYSYNVVKGPDNPNTQRAITAIICGDNPTTTKPILNNYKVGVGGFVTAPGIEVTSAKSYFGYDLNTIISKAHYIPDYICASKGSTVTSVFIGVTTGRDSTDKSLDVSDVKIVPSTSYNEGSAVTKINCTTNGVTKTYDVGFNWNAWYSDDPNWDSNAWKFSGGKTWADLFCEINDGINSHASAVYHMYTSESRYAPKIKIEGTEREGLSVTKVTCSNGETYTLSNGVDSFDGLNFIYIPINKFAVRFVNVYQPPHYANQTEILRRLCPNRNLVGYLISNDKESGLTLLWDVGSKGTYYDNKPAVELVCKM